MIDKRVRQALALAIDREFANSLAETLTETEKAFQLSFVSMSEAILLAVQADGRPITRTHLQALDRSRALYPQLQAQGWSLAVDQARMLACWTTDRSVPKRFNTAFFVALMPDQQEPVADEMEQFEPVWVRPEDALTKHQAGNFFMIFPTIRTLHWLSAFEQAGQALAACTEDEPLWNSTPRGGLVGGQPQRFMEQDLPYAELALVCPSGQL